MKRTTPVLILLALALLPLACQSRALTQPVNPTFAPTPTPTSFYVYNLVATPTATP